MLLISIFEFVWDHWFKILIGIVCAFWAIGSIFSIISSFIDSNKKKESDDIKLLYYGGGFVSLIVGIIMISSVSKDITEYNTNNSGYSSIVSNPSHNGEVTFREKACTGSVGCDCPGFEPVGSIGSDRFKCKHCPHPKNPYHHKGNL